MDDLKLINFAFTRKERLSIDKFTHDATYCPHVDFFSVAVIAQQQLRGALPAGGYLVGEFAVLPGHGTREPEIAELEHVLQVD